MTSVDLLSDSSDVLLLNEALFTRNRRAGYVLKSEALGIAGVSQLLKLTLLSGSQLRGQGEAYLQVIMRGEASEEKYCTKGGGSGVMPIWKEECQFLISEPELAFLHFKVTSAASGKSEMLGQQVVGVRNLRTGLRAVPLVGDDLESSARLLVYLNFA